MFRQIKELFSTVKKPAKNHPKTLQYEELEPRVLFSADFVPGLDDIAVEEQVLVQDIGSDFQVERKAAPETVEQTAAEARRELAIVSEDVADYDQLIADLQGGDNNETIEVVILESDRDGIEQVSEILSNRSDLAAVHVITHGADGQINLGNSRLTSTTIEENSDAVAGWGKALTETGDILFYGCNVAADGEGQSLLDNIAELTGAEVAASDDLTGSAEKGGDWELEYAPGVIETEPAFSIHENQKWSGLLAVPVANNDGYDVDEDNTLDIDAVSGILANDTDPDGDPLTVRLVSGPSNGTLVLNPVELTNETNLTNNTANDREADWSPDATKIAFRSDRDGNNDVWIMDADGSNLTQLTMDNGFNGRPVWSPDGTKIAFNSDRDGNYEIYVMNANGTNQTNLTNHAAGGDFAPSWSPDGTKIVFKSDRGLNDQIYIMNADGTGQTNITNSTSNESGPSWSPDGSKILFVSDRNSNSEIYVMDEDGSNPTRLTNDAATDTNASWSPNGSKIVFKSDRDVNNEIYVMDAGGSNLTRLTDNTYVDGAPVWSPDGSRIAFQTSRDDNHEIYVADFSSDGGFTYTPDADFNGTDSFTYVANDGTSDSNIATVTITVNPVNDAPTFIDGSVGNWDFDEGSGDSIVESAIGISTGTLGSTAGADANDPTWTTGKFGQALHFDGVDDYIEIADAPGIDISGPQFSASLWMNPDSGPNQEDMLFMKGDRQGNINYYLSWKDSGKMTWAFKDSAGWHYQDMPVTMPTTGQWNHIGITFDRPTVSLYVNGTKYVFDGGDPTSGSMDRDLTANDEVLWIGAGRDAGALVGVNQWSGPFTGSIDELALFDRALTDAEIEAIRTSTPPAVTASAFSIDENSANNTVVGTVVANDQDIGDTLSYAITAGNTGGAFSIDANGQIKVANSAALDFETNPTFNLTIEATDDGIPSLSDTTTVTISLNDVNDAPVAQNDGVHLSFDGDDFIQVADDASLQMTNNFTIEAWINHDGTGTGSKIIVNKEGEYEVGITEDTGEIKFAIANQGSPGNWDWHNTGYFVTLGEWTHVAVTYDGVVGEAKTYINGELVDTFAQSGVIGDVYPALNDLWIGGRQNDPDDRFTGQIDEVRVWGVTRTQGEIQANMDQQLTGAEAGFAGYWEFNEGTGSITFDKTGNGNDGTLGGGVTTQEPVWVRYAVDEDSVLNVPAASGVLANDIDSDNDLLTVTEVNGNAVDVGNPIILASGAQLTLNPDGSFTYTPSVDFNGTDSFTYKANDGSVDSNIATVTITVNPVNDAPAGANNTVSTNEDTDYTFTAADFGFTDVNDSPEDTLLNVIISTPPSNGTLFIDANDDGVVDTGETLTASAVVSLTDITAGKLKFKPVTDANGAGYDSFTFQVQDDGGTAYGGVDTDQTANTITIDVTSVNDGPVDLKVTSTTEGGTSINEDGGNDVYFVADDGAGLLGGLTTVTIEASFSITTPGADLSPLLSYAAGANDEELALFLKSDGRIWFGARSNGSPIQSTIGNYTQLFDGEVHHVGVSWDSSSGAVVFYVDGQQVESFAGYQTGQTIAAGGELVFGQDQDSVLGGFKTIDVFSGSLYDVRIFNDVRTAVEIVGSYNQTLPNTEPGMIANWTFNDMSTDGIITDAVSGNDLTMQHVGGGFTPSTSELTLEVQENAADETIIGTITGIDPDTGDTLIYSLLDDAGGRFDIVSGTGILKVADGSLLDYESDTSHNITVQVTDAAGSSYSEVMSVTVNPVNEAPTDITLDNNTVAENSSAGTVIGNLTATDPDLPDTATFAFVSGTGDADNTKFEIVGDELRVNTLLDFETQASYSVRIEVSDSVAETYEKAFTITVNDINDAPVITSAAAVDAAENQTAVSTVTATDADADTPTFTITGGADQGLFSITAGGVLTFNSGRDFEAFTDADNDGVYEVQVTADDGHSGSDVQTILVTVTDVNEAPSLVTLSSTTVDENTDTSGGYTVGSLTTTDQDAGDTTSYSINGGADAGVFSISGSDLILTDGLLDFESQASYEVTVRITDSGTLTHDQTFTITVNDLNEAPSFDSAAVTIATEDTLYSYNIASSDVDTGASLTITATSLPAWLTLSDNGDGTATLSGTPTNAEVGDHSVVLQVSDGSLIDTQSFTITVGNTNDAPGITSAAAVNAAENQTAVSTVTATDDDADTPTFTITGGADQGLFSITAGGVLTFNSGRDFEAFTDADNDGVYEVQVTADDGHSGSDVQTILVTVTDVNEAPSLVTLSSTNVDENTDTSGGYTVGSLTTTDQDAGDTTSYSINGGADAGVFSISGSDLILTDGVLDFETKASYEVTVRITDSGALTHDQTFTITVGNANDAPVITSAAAVDAAENQTAVSTVTATDADADTPTFTITGGADQGLFSITAGGVLTFNSGRDFEAFTDADNDGVYEVQVTADDGHSGSDVQTILVTVTDVNEAPSLVTLSSTTVDENTDTSGGYTVGSLTTTDQDAGDTTSYSINGGADAGVFSISGSDLILTDGVLDFETKASYEVTVRITDSGALTHDQTFTITVGNANDAPVITSAAAVDAAENQTAVSTVTATDADADTPTFTITGGADQGLFSITAGGVLTFNSGRDFEAFTDADNDGVYEVQVTADDGHSGSDVQTILVTVTDVNEAPSLVTLSSTNVDENTDTSGGYTVGSLTTTDQDAGDTTSYSINGGADAGVFSISGSDLILTDGLLDFETKASYEVTVRITDSGALTHDQTFTITVGNANDAPVITSAAAVDAAENQTAVSTVTATDADADTPTFTITGGADQGLFSITAGGVLTFNSGRDFEAFTDADNDGVYEVQVTADDGHSGSDVQTILVTVTDVNEAPSLVTLSSTNVDENTDTSGGYTVGSLTTTDQDAGDTTSYSINGGADAGVFSISGSDLILTDGLLDFETKASYEVTVRITDSGALTHDQTFTITVGNTNDAPVITSAAAVDAAENQTAVSTVTATDADADTPTFTITGGADQGLFSITAGGVLTFNSGRDFEAFTDADNDGVYEVQVTADDGHSGSDVQTILVTVTDVNEAPSLVTLSSTNVDENTDTSGGYTVGSLTTTDQDAGDTTSYSINGGADAGVFSISGSDLILTDGLLDFETKASYEVTVRITDSGDLTHDQTFTITVSDVNDNAPVIGGTTTGTVVEDGTLNANGTLTISDVDISDNPISFPDEPIILGDNGYGDFVLTGGTWTYTLNNAHTAVQALDVGESLTDTHIFTASDGSTQLVTMTINGAEDASVLGGVTAGAVTEDGALTASDEITITDVDTADNPVNWLDEAATAGDNGYGTFQLTGGTWTYTLNNAHAAVQALDVGENLTDTHIFTASDGSTQLVTMTINGAENAPIALDDAVSGNEDTVITGNVLTNDTDTETDPLTANLVSGPAHGSLTLSADGSFSYTPDADWNGTDSFTYTANDGALDSNIATMTITVNPVNDAPSVSSSAVTAATENAAYSYTITANDIDGDDLTITASTLPAWLTLVDNGDGTATLSGTPTNADVGEHSVELDISDGELIYLQDFTLTVSGATIDPPVDDPDPDLRGSTTPDPELFEDPETDDEQDPDTEAPTQEDQPQDPVIEAEQAAPVVEDLTTQDSAHADDQLVIMPDPQINEEILYLTDDDDMDSQAEERDDDPSITYYDNDLYKDLSLSKYVNINYTAADGSNLKSEDDLDILYLDSDDQIPVDVNGDYDLHRQQIDESFDIELKSQETKAKIVSVTAASFAAGFVSYLLRAGSLVANLMSTLPLWRGFDPIVIFSGNKKKKKKDRNEIPDTNEAKSETLFDDEVE